MKNMHIYIFLSVVLLVLSACGGGSSSVTGTGMTSLGVFDPSVARDQRTGSRLWRSYSSVETSIYYDSSVYWAVSIRLASSDDGGLTWRDAGLVAPKVETLLGPMTEGHPTGSIPVDSQGIWQSETSSLIYDPSANAGEEWKLVWHQYLNANLTSFFADYGWIAMKMASTPGGLAAAVPVKLFGGAGLQPDNIITASPVFAPIGGAPVIQLNTDLTSAAAGANLADLSLCIFAEPGLHATAAYVYLAIYCADASTFPITENLEYFRCISPCAMTDAAKWEYLGRLLTPADAQAATAADTNDHHYQAPDLVEKNGKLYLIVTPVNTLSGERYNGCRVYEFVDFNSNELVRDMGDLVEVARVDGNTGTHNGACSAHENMSAGILYSEFDASARREKFSIFQSFINIP